MEPENKDVSGFPSGSLKISFTLAGVCVSAVIYAFTNFVTKTELEAKQRVDDKMIEIVHRDLAEIKSDVKDLLKNSKRK